MLSSAVPICCRSPARPWVSLPSSRISTPRSCRWAAVVSITTDMLVITRPITSSRSARWLVSFAVCAIRSLIVGPWPCSTAVIWVASLFTSAGRSRSKSGLNALNSAVRSRPGLVRETGIVAPGESRL